MKILGIIPARGGSKGVPGKNIKLLGGKPLLVHAYDCAKQSKYEMDIVVSTDSEEIIKCCIDHNIKYFNRPTELAEDYSSVIPVIHHVLENMNESYDLIVLLQPTSPFRTGDQLSDIISFFEKDMALEGVISVVPVEDNHPDRMYRLNTENKMMTYNGVENETVRRQDLEPLYLRNGCFYAVRTAVFNSQNTVMPKHKKAYVMDTKYHVNIDTPRDFMLASLIYEEWKNENSNN